MKMTSFNSKIIKEEDGNIITLSLYEIKVRFLTVQKSLKTHLSEVAVK